MMRLPVALLAATFLLPAAASAQAVPAVVDIGFDPAPPVGQPSVISIRVADPRGHLTGIAVDFGAGEDAFAESACQGAPRATTPPGALEETFRIEHTYVSAQPRQVTVKVSTGTCTVNGPTVDQAFSVVPFGASTAPSAPVAGLPSLAGGGITLRGARIAQAGCGPDATLVPDQGNLSRIQVATECLVSAERTSRGLTAVSAAEGLRKAGLIQVFDMLRYKYFAHDREGGPDLFARLKMAGYKFDLAGENLGAGTGQYTTPAEMVQEWLASPPHRENMLDRDFREVGLGVGIGFPLKDDASGATYALEFGDPEAELDAAQQAEARRAAARRVLRKKCAKKSYRRKHRKACRRVGIR